MSIITESLASGFANQMKRESHARYCKAKAVLDTHLGALISRHAQCRAMQSFGSDVRVYGRELVKHAAVAVSHPDVSATFSNSGIALWSVVNGCPVPTCTTYIPADRLDKWSTPYARWQSGLSVDGAKSAARNLDEAIRLVMRGGGK
jgi:hypothetical protein